MNDTQIFQLLGISFFAIGIGMLTNPKFIKNILQDLERSTVGMFYGGLISLVIGFLLVSFHNVWTLNGSLVITLIGWLALVKGLAFLMFPMVTVGWYKNVYRYSDYISYGVTAWGIILLYVGYFA